MRPGLFSEPSAVLEHWAELDGMTCWCCWLVGWRWLDLQIYIADAVTTKMMIVMMTVLKRHSFDYPPSSSSSSS